MHITFDIVNKKGLTDLFAILRFECTLYVSSISLQGPFGEGGEVHNST